MSGTEIAYLVGALAVIGIFLLLVRRASERQAGESARAVRERLRARGRPDDDRDEPDDDRDDDRESEREDGEEAEEALDDDDADRDDDDDDDDEEEEDDADDAGDRDRDARREAAGKLEAGLAKTRRGFVARLGRLFSKKKITPDILAELEEVLLTADIGPKTANKLFQSIKSGLSRDELTDADAIWSKIRAESATILSVDANPLEFDAARPFVLLTIGVNGVGKTTTIGKIAAKLRGEGKRVLLGAGDTFRAAAVEQLEEWGKRADAPVVKGKERGDPASVIYNAIKRGVDEDYDVVICDTAGRLHTKVDLMDELAKVGRACDKVVPGAPHETWLVLDATTGQNAIQQATIFKEAVDITGIVLTKLDGTAKGGVILGICDELGVPVRYIGIGEQIDDLRPFDAEAFVSALYADAGDSEAA